jgi:hypothetical protein
VLRAIRPIAKGEQVRKLTKIEMCYAWCCLVWFIRLFLENGICKSFDLLIKVVW